MSRVADLLLAIHDKLVDETNLPVDVVVWPSHQREEVADGPRVVVVHQGRDIVTNQGPDTRGVFVGVGVIGCVDPPSGGDVSPAGVRTQEFLKADELNDVLESVIALWSPDGPLKFATLADHRFASIEQASAIDFDMYRERGVWLSVVTLTYYDNNDEG